MHKPHLALLLALAGLSLIACAAGSAPPDGAAAAGRSLRAYASEADLAAALETWRTAARQQGMARARPMAPLAMSAAPVAATPAPAGTAAAAQESAAGTAGDSITNVQTAGVDEGGIVKRAGDHLVVLRRGRLFTLRVGGDELRAAATVDAYAPGIDPGGAWYDELLVSGRTVVVIGYSYARGGTEIGLFDLAADGTLAWRATHHLRSFDYYSSRNYASRLIGHRLVFYTPTMLQPWGPPPLQMMPALRRWGEHRTQALPGSFERILPATRVYRTDDAFDPAAPLALHSVTSCDLGGAHLQCEASAVLAPPGRVFYVSAGSVYVWTHGQRPWGPSARRASEPAPSAVFRLPLDGAAPSALKVTGVPVDALSFLEDASGHLNVLLREAGGGDAMWGAERGRGRMALLRVPLAAFDDGHAAAAREHYRRLPGPTAAEMHNRYVGDWLLWGADDGAWALRFADGRAATALAPGHGVQRIEALGAHALLVGEAAQEGQALRFSAVRLDAARAQIAGTHTLPDARQGESRTHGFFYRADGQDDGVLGLPVTGTGPSVRPVAGGQGAQREAASVVFLRQRGLAFTALGALDSRDGGARDDACRASCVDWYGNARPLFMGGRVFALMGYELVEGEVNARWGRERITERRRLDFAPARQPTGRERATPFD